MTVSTVSVYYDMTQKQAHTLLNLFPSKL